MNFTIGEITAIILFFIGVYGVIARRNIIKTVMSIGIMEGAIILFFLAGGATNAERAPITGAGVAADPVPQALMITAIVIGVGVTAVALTMFISLYHRYGTTNWKKAQIARKEP